MRKNKVAMWKRREGWVKEKVAQRGGEMRIRKIERKAKMARKYVKLNKWTD